MDKVSNQLFLMHQLELRDGEGILGPMYLLLRQREMWLGTQNFICICFLPVVLLEDTMASYKLSDLKEGGWVSFRVLHGLIYYLIYDKVYS